MPGQAVAQTLKYAEVVDVDLDATNDVNFADVEDYGHRVVVNINKDCLDGLLGWARLAGQARPSARLVNTENFMTALTTALNSTYVDIDGVTGGLHFGTDNMNLNPDARLRADGVSANDIPLAFVLYKLYGSSSVPTLDNIYNLGDAHGMLSSETVTEAVTSSFQAAVAGAVDTMFRDLLAADPHRFFDASGAPVVGMFEVNRDIPAVGTWKITENDILELKLKMVFHSKITRRGVAGRENLLTSSDSSATQENQQTLISPDDYFYIRLQLKADPSAESGLPPPPPPPPQYTPLSWTAVGTASKMTLAATTMTYTGGYNWADGAYSSTRGYASNFTLQWKVTPKAGSSDAPSVTGGITTDVASVAYPVWTKIPYGLLGQQGGIQITEGDAQVGNYGSFSASSVFKITYDGVKIRYYVDGIMLREVARAANGSLFYPAFGLQLTATVSEILFVPELL